MLLMDNYWTVVLNVTVFPWECLLQSLYIVWIKMVDINWCTYFPCDCAAITDQADTGFAADRGNQQYKAQTEHRHKTFFHMYSIEKRSQ
jgi:hypothetical protein